MRTRWLHSHLLVTDDLRLKPDVVAPGHYIVSATANPTSTSCAAVTFTAGAQAGVKPLSGTSMATPLLAGHMGIVRQYFLEGFYPSGNRNLGNAFQPSASLLKAIAIAGAVELTGTKTSTSTQNLRAGGACTTGLGQKLIDPRPYWTQGNGRTQLNEVLYFGTGERILHIPSAVANASAFFDRAISTGDVHEYKYCLFPSTKEIRVALTWTDAPPSLSATRMLVNNLDLTVNFRGANVVGNSQGPMFQDLNTQVDDRNNAEFLYFAGTTGAKEDMIIQVKGTAVPFGPQLYSLVLTGAATKGDCNSVGSIAAPLSFLTGSGEFAQPSMMMMVVIMLLALIALITGN